MSKITSNKGMAALLSVIIISAATVVMSLNSSILSFGELEMGSNNNYGNTAYYAAEGCVEEMIRRSVIDEAFEVTDKRLDIGDAYCEVSVVGDSVDKIINSIGYFGNSEKRIIIDAIIASTSVEINNWNESDN